MDEREPTKEEIRAMTLEVISKASRSNMFGAHGVRIPGYSYLEREVMQAAEEYLLLNGFILRGVQNFTLNQKGIAAMDVGGLIQYLQQQRDHLDRENRSRDATIYNATWNKRGVIIATILSMVAVGISVFGLIREDNLRTEIEKFHADQEDLLLMVSQVSSEREQAVDLMNRVEGAADILRVQHEESNRSKAKD